MTDEEIIAKEIALEHSISLETENIERLRRENDEAWSVPMESGSEEHLFARYAQVQLDDAVSRRIRLQMEADALKRQWLSELTSDAFASLRKDSRDKDTISEPHRFDQAQKIAREWYCAGRRQGMYRLALQAGIEYQCSNTVRWGLVRDYSGETEIEVHGRKYRAIGHPAKGNAECIYRDGWIEFISLDEEDDTRG